MKKLFLILLVLSTIIYAKQVDIYGKVALKGSSPHSYLTIECHSTKKLYRIVNPKDFDLINKQGSKANIEATLLTKAKPYILATIKVTNYQPNTH